MRLAFALRNRSLKLYKRHHVRRKIGQGARLSKGRSLKVAFGGGSVPLWRKLVECWPDGEPVFGLGDLLTVLARCQRSDNSFRRNCRALNAKGASPLRNTNLSIIARPDAHGDSARPKFPFQIVERLRAKNFPVRKGRLSAARLDLLPEESVDTKGGHDRDLHAKHVVLRGPRTSVAYWMANFTCRGFGTAGQRISKPRSVCGPAEDLQSSWRPPIAQAGSVEWQTCGIGELAEYKSEDEAIAWPTFLNVVLEVSWNGCIDPTGRLLIRTLRDASTFFISIEGEAAWSKYRAETQQKLRLLCSSARKLFVRC